MTDSDAEKTLGIDRPAGSSDPDDKPSSAQLEGVYTSKTARVRTPIADRVWWQVPVLVALIVRIVWLTTVDTQPVTDFSWYFERAAGIARGMGYSVDGVATAYWPVGWPGFLGGVFAITGPSVLVAKVVTLLLGVLNTGLTFWAGRRLGLEKLPSSVAALAVGLSPAMVAYSTILASESLAIVLGLLGVCALIDARTEPGLVLAGVACGAGMLVRPQALVYTLAAIAVLSLCRKWPSRSRGVAVVLLGAALAVSPWTARNYVDFQALVPVSTNGGDNLLIGHGPGATGGYRNPRQIEPRINHLSEAERDRAAGKIALFYLRQDPARAVRAWPAKLRETFLKHTDAAYWAFQTEFGSLVVPGAGTDKAQYLAFRNACYIGGNGLLALALLGAAVAAIRRQCTVALAVGAAWLGVTAVLAGVFFGNGRFGLVTVPFQAILFAAGIQAAMAGRRSL